MLVSTQSKIQCTSFDIQLQIVNYFSCCHPNMSKTGKVRCNTCDKETQITAPDSVSLIQAIEAGVLSYHVQTPCQNCHDLRIDIDLPYMQKNQLIIECLRCKQIAKWREKSILKMEVPIMLVNSAAICFHAAHESHPFHLKYIDTKTDSVIFEVKSPGLWISLVVPICHSIINNSLANIALYKISSKH